MKKTFTKISLSLLLSLPFIGSSQSSILITNITSASTVAPNSVIALTTATLSNTQVTFDITNTSSSTKSYNAKRYDGVLNPGADAYFCFAGTCYSSATFSAGILTLNGGQSASQLPGAYNVLIADLDEGNTVGYSMIMYTFWNDANPSDSVQVRLEYNGTTGIHQMTGSLGNLYVYPNPVSNNAFLYVNCLENKEVNMTVVNSLGATISEKQVSLNEGKNKIDLHTGDLSNGIYFVVVKDGQSTVTKKFIVK